MDGWFPLSYRNQGMDRLTYLLSRVFGGGPDRSGARVTATTLDVRTPGFKLSVPRSAVAVVHRSAMVTHGTTGVHLRRGNYWLVNGGPDGLVEIVLDPPASCTARFGRLRRSLVRSLVLSLTEPDKFVAALAPPKSRPAPTRTA